MKTMFIGFAFVLVGLTMQLGAYIVASSVMTLGVRPIEDAVELVHMAWTLRTGHIVAIGGLLIMSIEMIKGLIMRIKGRHKAE
ncbi:MAG: hypothetical protein FWE34_03715 [Defluviitaleaceae bacterium]|nr:hypothetical protein [Defluviitaleaceae bacterium]